MSDSAKDRIEGTLDKLQGEGKEGVADAKDKAGDLLKKATGGN